jgi:hypothetical protein
MATKPAKRLDDITVRDAQLIFKNFAGRESQYNKKGDRNFHLRFDNEADAMALSDLGLNVKMRKGREEDDAPYWHLKVKVGYNGARKPLITVITERGRVNYDESMAELVDVLDIKKVDLILHPSWYEVNGSTGFSAYLKSIYLTLNEDELALEYGEIDEIDNSAHEQGDEDYS